MGDCYRLTHHKDPVPHLPSEIDFYEHTMTEVFYNEKQTEYTICKSQEDKNCSDQYLFDLNVSDHLNYINFDFTANYLTCKL